MFSDNLIQLRKLKHMSQEELALGDEGQGIAIITAQDIFEHLVKPFQDK